MDFGRVLGGFWEVKNLDFRTFFDVVSMLNFERCFESKNLRKKCQTMKFDAILGRAGGMCGVLGREKERGSEACWDRILEKNIF